MQIRWQRLARELKPDDGPEVEVLPFDELPRRLPHYERQRVTGEEAEERFADYLAVGAKGSPQ